MHPVTYSIFYLLIEHLTNNNGIKTTVHCMNFNCKVFLKRFYAFRFCIKFFRF